MENIKIGYIGLGCRGKDLLENIVLAQKEQVTAVCDVYEDRAQEGAKVVEAAGQPTPFVLSIIKKLLQTKKSIRSLSQLPGNLMWRSHWQPCMPVKRSLWKLAALIRWKTVTNWWMLMKKPKHHSCSLKTAASAAEN